MIAIVREAQTQFDCKVKRLYADGGTEFINSTLESFCCSNGISLHHPPARTQQLNGIAENAVKSSKDDTRTLLLASGMPTRFWAKAASHVTYVWNRSHVSDKTGVTPYESLHGKAPSARHWGVWGCDAYFHVPKGHRGATLEPKAEACIYIGHDWKQNAARVYVLRTGKQLVTRDVTYRSSSFRHAAALTKGAQAVQEIASEDTPWLGSSSVMTDEARSQGGTGPQGGYKSPLG